MEESVVLNNRYQLLELVGTGGMATVYKARDRALGRLVAVKLMHESLTKDAGFLHRFQREAHAAANLTHPNIVTVHDIGRDDSKHYIVMEYVDGRTLKQIIRDNHASGRHMPVSRALDLTVQICNGIGYAHRANLVHCDVKPQNVLVTRDDRVKVADFGIARALDRLGPVRPESKVWGTPQYFAPEQATGEAPSPASDVYAIGVVLFELLSNRTPFQADTPTMLALQHVQERPPFITTLNPAVSPQLGQVIEKVLSKEPAGRYRTAGQLGRILTSYRQNNQQDTLPPMSLDMAKVAGPMSEQRTQAHRRPTAGYAPTAQLAAPASQPVRERQQVPGAARTVHVRARQEKPQSDWLVISLGLLALFALLGLIPLWYMVFRAFVP